MSFVWSEVDEDDVDDTLDWSALDGDNVSLPPGETVDTFYRMMNQELGGLKSNVDQQLEQLVKSNKQDMKKLDKQLRQLKSYDVRSNRSQRSVDSDLASAGSQTSRLSLHQKKKSSQAQVRRSSSDVSYGILASTSTVTERRGNLSSRFSGPAPYTLSMSDTNSIIDDSQSATAVCSGEYEVSRVSNRDTWPSHSLHEIDEEDDKGDAHFSEAYSSDDGRESPTEYAELLLLKSSESRNYPEDEKSDAYHDSVHEIITVSKYETDYDDDASSKASRISNIYVRMNSAPRQVSKGHEESPRSQERHLQGIQTADVEYYRATPAGDKTLTQLRKTQSDLSPKQVSPRMLYLTKISPRRGPHKHNSPRMLSHKYTGTPPLPAKSTNPQMSSPNQQDTSRTVNSTEYNARTPSSDYRSGVPESVVLNQTRAREIQPVMVPPDKYVFNAAAATIFAKHVTPESRSAGISVRHSFDTSELHYRSRLDPPVTASKNGQGQLPDTKAVPTTVSPDTEREDDRRSERMFGSDHSVDSFEIPHRCTSMDSSQVADNFYCRSEKSNRFLASPGESPQQRIPIGSPNRLQNSVQAHKPKRMLQRPAPERRYRSAERRHSTFAKLGNATTLLTTKEDKIQSSTGTNQTSEAIVSPPMRDEPSPRAPLASSLTPNTRGFGSDSVSTERITFDAPEVVSPVLDHDAPEEVRLLEAYVSADDRSQVMTPQAGSRRIPLSNDGSQNRLLDPLGTDTDRKCKPTLIRSDSTSTEKIVFGAPEIVVSPVLDPNAPEEVLLLETYVSADDASQVSRLLSNSSSDESNAIERDDPSGTRVSHMSTSLRRSRPDAPSGTETVPLPLVRAKDLVMIQSKRVLNANAFAATRGHDVSIDPSACSPKLRFQTVMGEKSSPVPSQVFTSRSAAEDHCRRQVPELVACHPVTTRDAPEGSVGATLTQRTVPSVRGHTVSGLEPPSTVAEQSIRSDIAANADDTTCPCTPSDSLGSYESRQTPESSTAAEYRSAVTLKIENGDPPQQALQRTVRAEEEIRTQCESSPTPDSMSTHESTHDLQRKPVRSYGRNRQLHDDPELPKDNTSPRLEESWKDGSLKKNMKAVNSRSSLTRDVDGERASVTSSVARVEQARNKMITDPYGDKGQYTGQLVRGRPHGHGTMKYEDERLYVGEWKHGRWHGAGRAVFANGDAYVGEYSVDQRHGFGRYQWADKRVYDGEFCRDQRHGSGTYSWPDGSSYVGEFVFGQRNGHGVYTFMDGSTYCGGWKDGKYDGRGECRWADGRTYSGEWVRGHANGYGIETRADGSIRHKGVWKEDRPVKKKSDRAAKE